MRLFRVTTECRKCTHRYMHWINEPQRKAAFQRPPDELLTVQRCQTTACAEKVPIFARHLREATFDLGATQEAAKHPQIRKTGAVPNLIAPVPKLTERQARICALILEGHTARRIARTLHVSTSTVRDEVRAAARVLCADEPIACRVLPRQTVVAYYTTRVGSAEPENVFQSPA